MADVLKLEFGPDGVARIVMCNGENRLRMSTLHTWGDVLDKVIGNREVNGLIITGEGKYFSNGIDLDWMRALTETVMMEFLDAFIELTKRLMTFPVPTVAVVNGHAFAGGAFLAIACDYRVMRADRGWLCLPEVHLGLRFPPGLMSILRAKVPVGPAQRDAIIHGKRLTGDAARQLGLVDVVAEVAELDTEGRKLLRDVIGRNGFDRDTLHAIKTGLYLDDLTVSKL